MRRIVDSFYSFEDFKDSILDAQLVSTLKDAEMYMNIYSKRSLDIDSVEIIKQWIYMLSAQKWANDEEKEQRNQKAKELLEWITFKKL